VEWVIHNRYWEEEEEEAAAAAAAAEAEEEAEELYVWGSAHPRPLSTLQIWGDVLGEGLQHVTVPRPLIDRCVCCV
jgi:hypothetical protein